MATLLLTIPKQFKRATTNDYKERESYLLPQDLKNVYNIFLRIT